MGQADLLQGLHIRSPTLQVHRTLLRRRTLAPPQDHLPDPDAHLHNGMLWCFRTSPGPMGCPTAAKVKTSVSPPAKPGVYHTELTAKQSRVQGKKGPTIKLRRAAHRIVLSTQAVRRRRLERLVRQQRILATVTRLNYLGNPHTLIFSHCQPCLRSTTGSI
jgi:hypothetical protein